MALTLPAYADSQKGLKMKVRDCTDTSAEDFATGYAQNSIKIESLDTSKAKHLAIFSLPNAPTAEDDAKFAAMTNTTVLVIDTANSDIYIVVAGTSKLITRTP